MNKKKKAHPMYSFATVSSVKIMLTPAETRKARKRYIRWRKK